MVISPNAGVEARLKSVIEKLDKIEAKIGATDIKNKGCSNRFGFSVEMFQIFNAKSLETELSPWAEWGGDTLNVYWKRIEQAAEYKITLYKNAKGQTYKLKDFMVARTEGYLAVDNLVGGGYIIKVSALDRNGNIVAEARGIDGSGLPIDWEMK